jgi:hypothetical protein
MLGAGYWKLVTYRQKIERQKAEEKQSAFTVTLQPFEEALPDKQRPNS